MQFPIEFTKMSGTGNDFILIDHRTPFLSREEMPGFSRAVCERRVSAGADGLILIENSEAADFRWQFLNADGSWAEMCGNGARCAARFAFALGIAPARMRFETVAGIIEAEVTGQSVKLKMTAPTNLRLHEKLMVNGEEQVVHSLNTGVPHAVLFMEDIRQAPVMEWGRTIRFHEHFQPAGTNVNFVQQQPGNGLIVRTYERGVEGETLACGTGAVSAAIIAGILGQVQPPVTVTTSGGERLVIHYALAGQEIAEVFLEGPANFIYAGQMHAEAIRKKS
ncbi:MAG: diaminopimelate epimerase [Proteobacteria bacterium]|nr:diaminopimelate epimerase [Pseudomonadota bacterium]MBU1547472.1 diaminopimelate epimerase [Pseudomonadota bacterium]MBU2619661.1 diaminopimelate epimerase [Pseudomonadota bacterium]